MVKVKIALVCSHGGHLTEMLYLMDAFEGHDVFFATYDNIRTRNLQYKKYLFPNFGESPLKLFRHLPGIIKVFLKEKPDLIVSNGAEIAVPFFYISKLFRIKTAFIECYTRIDMPTITGKLVYWASNLFLVLWPEMLGEYGKKAKYWGGIFKINDSPKTKNNGEIVLVMTGMHSGFDRLIKKMDNLAASINNEVVMQIGNSQYIPKNAEYFRFKEYSEIKGLITQAKFFICQGAMSAIDALIQCKSTIIVPRLKEEGEVINDHQLFFAKKLEESGLVTICNDINNLEDELSNPNFSKNKCISIDTELINKLKDFIND